MITMMKRFFTLLSLLMFSFSGSAAAKMGEAGRIVASIKPLHSLVSEVMGGVGSPSLLVKGINSPHDVYLKPSQMQLLQDASVVFYIDPAYETFLQSAFQVLPETVRTVSLMAAGGVKRLPERKGGAWEALHDHSHHDHHGDHGQTPPDLHIWLDPKNAIAMVQEIADVLSEIDPENRDIYNANADRLAPRLRTLDAELQEVLAPLKDQAFIVFHDAYQYFEKAYGLRGVGSITLEPDESASPKRIQAVRAKLKETGAECVFREPQFSDHLIDTVIEGTEAKRGTLDPLGADLNDGEGLYFHLLRNMASSIQDCLRH